MPRKPKTVFSRLIDRFSPPVGLLLLILSAVVGAGTGLAAVVFIKLIAVVHTFCFTTLPELFPAFGPWVFLLAPIGGALLIGPLIIYAKETKSSGVPEVMQALILHGGRIRARVAGTKIIGSALCIGSGGSAGREGPIVQIGASLGSAIGQLFRLSDDRIRNLLGCGTAAGIAAAFNTPIAGVVFSIEVLMGNLQVRSFGNVVIAAVAGSIVSRHFLGSRPAFAVPLHAFGSPLAIFFYLLLGLLSALVGIMFIKMLSRSESFFENLACPQLLKPAAGAVLLGLLGLLFTAVPTGNGGVFPQLFTVDVGEALAYPHFYSQGFVFIESVLHGGIPFWLLLLLLFLKPLATALTLGSGSPGGVFGPSLFIGAMLGGCLGIVFKNYFPEISGEPGAYVLVGMAAMFAATARAPLTGMLTVFELSNDYLMILPIMVAAITASYFASWLHPESIFTIKLAKRGIRFYEGRDMDIMQGVKVEEVMRTQVISVDKDQPLPELMALFQETNLVGFPVVTQGRKLWGIITLQDVHRAQSQGDGLVRDLKVADLAVEGPISVFPDEPIWVAIQKMSPRDLARLPVISRDGSMRLVGMISRSDILRAYDVGVVRKQRGQIMEQQTTLRSSTETGFVEFVLNEDDSCCNVSVKDLPLPQHVNLVSIRREGKTIIPRGNHQLLPGDVLTVFGRLEEINHLKDFLNSCPLPSPHE
ncbi:chloride channel protein [Desulfofustis limnaeus]|jgi:CIC family chloride channel protein|uniref:Cl- channel voltage-gated family protein n=1 Tax=Desulfofustis limnaeus TaxID=2740163 RepID=A0ABN6M894_9BACT|nr:chloride channel protein [Desulfofustis limnaeus]MDX9896011.1 chloride channel protein [Desulfofustis sp.]BDD88525.1 Cl- channel voltage-gated family protein [Desulfofustis limnaeus]